MNLYSNICSLNSEWVTYKILTKLNIEDKKIDINN